MKKIEALIKADKSDDVISSLEKIGFPDIIISKIEGSGSYGDMKEEVRVFRGTIYSVKTTAPKVRIEVVVNDKDLVKTLKVIREAALSDENVGDKIFVLPLEDTTGIGAGKYSKPEI